MNRRTTIFICTLLFLGIGIAISFCFKQYEAKKRDTHVIQNTAALINKYNAVNQQGKQDKQEKMDLSSDQDLTVAVMNLIGIEEHLFFTGAKTRKTEYYDLINEVREVRKAMLKKLIPQYEGEAWCISKHLLASSYRLMEVGTKQLNLGNKQEAYNLFDQAYKLYLLFWKINSQTISNQTNLQPSENIKTNLHDTGIPAGKACVFDGSKINCCAE